MGDNLAPRGSSIQALAVSDGTTTNR